MTLKDGPLEKGGKATKHPLERAIPTPRLRREAPIKIVTKLPPLKEAALEKAAKPSTAFNEAPLAREAKHLPAPLFPTPSEKRLIGKGGNCRLQRSAPTKDSQSLQIKGQQNREAFLNEVVSGKGGNCRPSTKLLLERAGNGRDPQTRALWKGR